MEALSLQRGEAVTPECKPDTLYSWGGKVKVTTAETTLPDGGPWDTKANRGGHGTIYSSASAVATFGYGPYLIRYKMREEAPFVGDDPSPDVVNASTSWREYIFSRSKHFEGWSTGTPEIYDEVVRDLLRYASDERVEPYPPPSEWTKDKQGNLPRGLARLFAQAEDGNVQDEPTLKRALLTLIGQILHGEGRISYAPGTCRNRKLHYQTNKPSYINPYGK